jgi:hypothetical protein
MSEIDIKKDESIVQFIKSFERMRDKIHHPIKTPLDPLICPICAGKYRRRDKSKHASGKKHNRMLKMVHSGKVNPILEWDSK